MFTAAFCSVLFVFRLLDYDFRLTRIYKSDAAATPSEKPIAGKNGNYTSAEEKGSRGIQILLFFIKEETEKRHLDSGCLMRRRDDGQNMQMSHLWNNVRCTSGCKGETAAAAALTITARKTY